MMQKYPDYNFVQKCLRRIEAQLDWGTSQSWHNDVFLELSERIQNKTNVLLSPTTLKRVWGKVDYKSAPSISTLNTLAQFAGFVNWRDFKNSIPQKKESWLARTITPNLGIIITSAAIMTLIFISFYSMIGSNSSPASAIDYSQVSFSSHPIAKGLPNSVVFNFDVSTLKTDSLYIQQYWDPNRTIKINTDQKQATGIYYFPGYFRAKLLADGKRIKGHDLFITSEGWLGTLDYKPLPKYLLDQQITKGSLSFPESILNEIRAREQPLVSSYHYVGNFGNISGDNFSLATRVRSIYNEKWAVCQYLRLFVLGTKGAFVIPFSIPGCASDLGLMLNDVYVNGKEHDLSALGSDFTTYRDINLNVENKKVTIRIDDKIVYSKKYNESIGNFVGLRYKFLGAGEVAHVRIYEDNKKSLFFEENFDQP